MDKFTEISLDINNTAVERTFNSRNFRQFEKSVAKRLSKLTGLNFYVGSRDYKECEPDILCDEKPRVIIECKIRESKFPTFKQLEDLYKETNDKYNMNKSNFIFIVFRYKGRKFYTFEFNRYIHIVSETEFVKYLVSI